MFHSSTILVFRPAVFCFLPCIVLDSGTIKEIKILTFNVCKNVNFVLVFVNFLFPSVRT
jgi:hypothetical protein